MLRNRNTANQPGADVFPDQPPQGAPGGVEFRLEFRNAAPGPLGFNARFIARGSFNARFIAGLLLSPVGPIPGGPVGVQAGAPATAPWGIPKSPTSLDHRSDDFLCGAGTSEGFDDRTKRRGDRHRPSPRSASSSTSSTNISNLGTHPNVGC
jgi:hypothetical protein